jgi:hypothetical protein
MADGHRKDSNGSAKRRDLLDARYWMREGRMDFRFLILDFGLQNSRHQRAEWRVGIAECLLDAGRPGMPVI